MPDLDPYDRVPYTDHAYAESHPDRLAVVARLAGWAPPDVARARVLELGCGRGGNLLPMASGLPGASLVGVDRAKRQVDEARRIAAEAGIANARFEVASFEDARIEAASFDFVVAHGVCSWVPPASRRALLAAIARSLAPAGIAYVSFNVLPGWYERMAARDWLRARPGEDARASLAWLRDHASPELADYRRRLDAVVKRLGETDAAYAAHEYGSEEHHPLLTRDLLAEAADAGLAYLGDAIPAETALEMLPPEVHLKIAGGDAATVQDVVDFARNTAFRRALFVRADEARTRRWRWTAALKSEALADMRVASRLRPSGTERFDGPDASVQVTDAGARRALHMLAGTAPRAVAFAELAAAAGGDAGGLRRELFDLWLATGAVDLHVHEPAIAAAVTERPLACSVARWHAAHGGPITNLWHQEVRFDDPRVRAVLALLDGTRDVAAIARDAGCAVEIATASVRAIAAAALLVA